MHLLNLWRKTMNKSLPTTIILLAVIASGYLFTACAQPLKSGQAKEPTKEPTPSGVVNEALAARFDYLSKNTTSSCALSVSSMPDEARLQGSCCGPMVLSRYIEEVEGLKAFKAVAGQNIDKIPDDPYDISVRLAKELASYYDLKLTPEEQKHYDYAMQHSDEKGPCCCPCWRWNVYGGLGKYLIKNHGFTGEQVTQVWNLSDACGGDKENQPNQKAI